MGSAKIRDCAEQIGGDGSVQEIVPLEKWLDRNGVDLLLKGTTCAHCGKSFFPPKGFCPSCGELEEIRDVLIGPKAKIHAFTVARIAATGFPVPYAFGWVDFPEGIRFLAQFDRCEGLEIGMEVMMKLGKIRRIGDITQFGPVFTVADGGGK